jgi:hypothetical protein
MTEQHDAHVRHATKMFRDVGYMLSAMAFKRPPEALAALKRFNGLSDFAPVPFAWGYFPNAHMRDNWQQYYLTPKQTPADRSDKA